MFNMQKKLGKTIRENHSLPMFWIIEAKQFILDADALRRQQGLGMMLGGHGGLAMMMGPDEDMAKEVLKEKIVICQHCAVNSQFNLYVALTEGK